jgi:DNA polymerase-1
MLNAPDGTPTNGVYGFLTILQRLLEEEKPEALCVAFDLKAPTFRHEKFAQYKAKRKSMPEELAAQMPVLKEVLDAMGVRRCEQEGFEADDLIGAVSKRCAETGWDCCIVTGDRDSFQLITDSVYVDHIKTRLGQTETVRYDRARFEEEYGFAPPRMVDLKALMGDSSDGIPGVPGVGEKTAMELMHRFGSLEGVYAHLHDPRSGRASVKSWRKAGRAPACPLSLPPSTRTCRFALRRRIPSGSRFSGALCTIFFSASALRGS